jgi:hypothetical protein
LSYSYRDARSFPSRELFLVGTVSFSTSMLVVWFDGWQVDVVALWSYRTHEVLLQASSNGLKHACRGSLRNRFWRVKWKWQAQTFYWPVPWTSLGEYCDEREDCVSTFAINMALDIQALREIDTIVGQWCLSKVPAHLKQQIDYDYEVDGQAVSIFEVWPIWKGAAGETTDPLLRDFGLPKPVTLGPFTRWGIPASGRHTSQICLAEIFKHVSTSSKLISSVASLLSKKIDADSLLDT